MAVGAVYKMDTCTHNIVTIIFHTVALVRHALHDTDEQCCGCRDYPAVLPVLLKTAAHTI